MVVVSGWSWSAPWVMLYCIVIAVESLCPISRIAVENLKNAIVFLWLIGTMIFVPGNAFGWLQHCVGVCLAYFCSWVRGIHALWFIVECIWSYCSCIMLKVVHGIVNAFP